jgi:hypothetical protein
VLPLQVESVACAPLHATPHPLQLAVVLVGVSHPFVSGAVALQSANPGSHPVYVQLDPLHAAPVLWAVSHVSPHALQFVVVLVGVSQPSVSGGVLLQSSQPGLQLVYVQRVPPLAHEAPLLWTVSQVAPQPPQLAVDAVAVSQPFVSGALVSQSAHPGAQPVYWHVVPLQVAPVLWLVSHESPQALQFAVVFVGVSQPFVSGAVFVQSAQPGEQPV